MKFYLKNILFFRVAFLLIIVELLSLLGHMHPWINYSTFWILIFSVAILSIRHIQWGLIAVCIELIMGSKGYLFSFPIGSFVVSLRMGLFIVVMVTTGVMMWRRHIFVIARLRHRFFWFMSALVLIWGVLIAFMRHIPLSQIFSDVNGYGAALLIIPALIVAFSRQEIYFGAKILAIAFGIMTIKTLCILILFSHPLQFTPYLPEVYHWIRDTGVGEITQFSNGYVRIFFQSHIYAVLLFLSVSAIFLLGTTWSRRQQWGMIVALIFSTTLILTSYSRSFWMASALGGISIGCYAFFFRRCSFRVFIQRIVYIIFAFACGIGIVVSLVNLPLPGAPSLSAGELLRERTIKISTEPAAASRWQLLRPLVNGIRAHPFFGSGFGSTLTYISNDPRIRAEHPDGRFTTTMFEWGYLDMLFDVGIFGVLIWGAFIFVFLRDAWKELRAYKSHAIIAWSGFLGLLITHIFTPYLNHPLGLGALVMIIMYTHGNSIRNPVSTPVRI